MRYHALATDYDGTLAHDGVVAPETIRALEDVTRSGRHLLLVSGRELGDLMRVFPRLDLFDRVVAENGGLLYRPSSRERKLLGTPPPPEFVAALRARHVEPLTVGASIVATWHPHEVTVLEVIRELGLELQVIFNKGAVMVLPAGVNKGSGLHAALNELALSPHNVVGIGDAENDHAFLRLCELSTAVANALPSLKAQADYTTRDSHGAGVTELMRMLLADDLANLSGDLKRHTIPVGTQPDGSRCTIKAAGSRVLVTGRSGAGKSTFAAGFMERIAAQAYQYCLVDPEGDYESVSSLIELGDTQTAPTVDEMMQVLTHPSADVALNMLGVPFEDRPRFFRSVLSGLQRVYQDSGRPHWLVVDEAHHLLPPSWDSDAEALLEELPSLLTMTTQPGEVSRAVLRSITWCFAGGDAAGETLAEFAEARGSTVPTIPDEPLEDGEMLVWEPDSGIEPYRVLLELPEVKRLRHRRKYAEGELGDDRSFYFRGPTGALNLRAQNLTIFLQIASGIDDETWEYHLRRGDYSRWIGQAIKDETLAGEIQRIEKDTRLRPDESRRQVRDKVEGRYAAPA